MTDKTTRPAAPAPTQGPFLCIFHDRNEAFNAMFARDQSDVDREVAAARDATGGNVEVAVVPVSLALAAPALLAACAAMLLRLSVAPHDEGCDGGRIVNIGPTPYYGRGRCCSTLRDARSALAAAAKGGPA